MILHIKYRLSQNNELCCSQTETAHINVLNVALGPVLFSGHSCFVFSPLTSRQLPTWKEPPFLLPEGQILQRVAPVVHICRPVQQHLNALHKTKLSILNMCEEFLDYRGLPHTFTYHTSALISPREQVMNTKIHSSDISDRKYKDR